MDPKELTHADAMAFERCMAAGGVALFPSDTVYGLACDPNSPWPVQRVALMKNRSRSKPSAVMFFDVAVAFASLSELEPRIREACDRLLPGAVTLLLPNPAHRFAIACGDQPDTLGLRVPKLPWAAAELESVKWPVMQTSANRSGEREARRLEQVEPAIVDACDLVLDAGQLPGIASTVIDLRRYEQEGVWAVVREGAVSADEIATVLGEHDV
jgi:L-threonylcarbamoyladenylate synthase